MEEDGNDPWAWVKALIKAEDLVAAEVLVSKMPEDFEKVYGLLMLAEGYHKYGKHEKARSRASKAVTLWNLGRDEWWFFPMLGDLLRRLVESGQPELAERLIEESLPQVEGSGHAWFETHGWCGLAQGAAYLEQRDKAEGYLKKAVHIAESRSTSEEQDSAMSIVDTTLKVITGKRASASKT